MANTILTAWTAKLLIASIDEHYLKLEMEDIEVCPIWMLQKHVVKNVAVNREELKVFELLENILEFELNICIKSLTLRIVTIAFARA